ncbi:P-loop containing nucleoside triphosphate hydrolase protein [Schizopora paradoxa]|uniref:RNA helicase n=1 Tax=Schizopora paradoxa TaxID=27342 RepID=A0A0H2SRB8_9AGAM|nr:P-loop containing nucleoside triphosphate hydrolase protein [Schizopora paradoxa]
MLVDRTLAIDRIYTRRLFQWVKSNPHLFTEHVNSIFAAILEATDYSHPAEWYPKTLALRRKVIMHVGPTNSGKTYNALRALASARFGVYAGPLRLLAVEIFDRFNRGTILPKDADPNAVPGTYKRTCNLLTGEEIRTLDDDAGLLSCTVEMLSSLTRYDVAVIDEIQMLTDPERGGAWTAAVLGTSAAELHLCGEESVVPLVQQMLKDTGDEVIVNRYERLTPLVVAPNSLHGNLKGIEKGDCVVSFSRNRIFSLKQAIEEKTGMRCALAYGRLPPEVRSEQAELFNDPNSGYDVLVGSDAIGMGLNLRIKRIVLDTVSKWDGVKERALSLSQIKQIAGRAGRYGLHEDETVGVVTALKESDMGLIRKALATTIKPGAQRAVLPRRTEEHSAIEQLLISPASFASVFELQSFLARYGPSYTMREITGGMQAATAIDNLCGNLTLEERILVFNAPVQWRDEVIREAMVLLLSMYRDDMNVDLTKALEDLNLLDDLLHVEEIRAGGSSTEIPSSNQLQSLEGLYRVLVVYKWFHNRFPLAFCQGQHADDLKLRTEDAIEWCLERIRAKNIRKYPDEPTHDVAAEVPLNI